MKDFYTLELENNISYKLYLPNTQSNFIEKYITNCKVPFEYDILKDMICRIPPKSVVLDIGMNIGNHSMFLAANGFKVYAFEAQKRMIDIAKKAIEVNHFESLITLYEYGLSDKNEEAYFEVENHENYGAMSLTCVDPQLNREYKGEKVICKPLDSFDISEKISLIKIDVEGMEPKVIRGGGITHYER